MERRRPVSVAEAEVEEASEPTEDELAFARARRGGWDPALAGAWERAGGC